MPETYPHEADARLTLRSRLDDLKLVWPWVDALAAAYAIPAETRFRIDLCLEEALSNIVRHGYAGEPNHAITIDFSADEKSGLTFVVEDNAPHFSPVSRSGSLSERALKEAAASHLSLDEIKPGGQGIPLLKKFAGSLVYEQLPDGNRLTIGFPAAVLESTSTPPR